MTAADHKPPNAETFRLALAGRLAEAERMGYAGLEVVSGDLHRNVGGYPGPNHAMPTCCDVMRAAMRPGDVELSAPPKSRGATLVIRYQFPRGQQ